MKTCKTCKVEKPFEFFGTEKAKSGNTVYRPYCKSCRAEKGRNGRKDRMQKTCCNCEGSWEAKMGKARRKIDLCDNCYPFYRTAYNLYYAALLRSTKNKLPFDLELKDIHLELVKGVCPKTGIEFEIKKKGSDYSNRSPFAPSIDKINPSKGYTKDNIQIVCWWYNAAKGRYTDEEVFELCKAVILQHS